MAVRKGDSQYIRGLNEQLIMDVIFLGGKVSRAEVSRLTSLSKPTVSSSVQRLIDKELIWEVGPGENAQGRKATMLEFNHASYYVWGIDLGAATARIALARMDGILLAEDQLNVGDAQPEPFLRLLLERIERLMQLHGIEWDRVPFVSVGMPAVVSPDTGAASSIVSPLSSFEQAFSLQSLVKLFPATVLIENDVNLATMAEQSDGIAANASLFMYVAIGAGVGAGLVVEGRLLRGRGGAAGEIGSMQLGQDGLVEDLLSTGGLMALTYNRIAADQQQSILRRHADHELNPALLFEAVRRQDALAVDIMESYCGLLVMAIHNMNVIVAPELIVLGGEIGCHSDVLIPMLHKMADIRFPIKPNLAASLLGEKAVLLGAVNRAKQCAYKQIRDELAAK